MYSSDRHRVFKSLETDREFCDRVRNTYPWYRGDNYYKATELDDEVWDAFKMQRRLIERSTEQHATR